MRFAVPGLAAAVALAVAGLTEATPSSQDLSGACAKANLKLLEPGRLTLGTDNPALPPWWDGREKKGTGFNVSNPYSGNGFESAVAYEIAKRLHFSRSEVAWKVMSGRKSYAPGKKPFDFYLAQISVSPVQYKAVSFSSSYYYVDQAVVALKGKPITKAKSIAALKPYTLGARIGAPSYSYIVHFIKPAKKPKVYYTVDEAVTALKNKQIDGFVLDYAGTSDFTTVQAPNSTVVGRLPKQGKPELFRLVFQNGNPLVACVNTVLASMRSEGALRRLAERWLAPAGGAPLLKK